MLLLTSCTAFQDYSILLYVSGSKSCSSSLFLFLAFLALFLAS